MDLLSTPSYLNQNQMTIFSQLWQLQSIPAAGTQEGISPLPLPPHPNDVGREVTTGLPSTGVLQLLCSLGPPKDAASAWINILLMNLKEKPNFHRSRTAVTRPCLSGQL